MAKPKKIRDLQRAAAKKRNRRGVAKAEANRAAGKTPLHEPGRRYNGYQCDPKGGCGGIYLTVDLDPGVTPMFGPCLVTPDCDGMAVSLGYPRAVPPLKLPLLVEWYSPANEEMKHLPKDLQGHVRQGGLLRRPAYGCPEWVAEKIGPTFLREGEQFMQPTLTLIMGDNDASPQEQGDHVHHAGSEGSGGEGADSGDPGSGEALGEGQEGPGQPGQ